MYILQLSGQLSRGLSKPLHTVTQRLMDPLPLWWYVLCVCDVFSLWWLPFFGEENNRHLKAILANRCTRIDLPVTEVCHWHHGVWSCFTATPSSFAVFWLEGCNNGVTPFHFQPEFAPGPCTYLQFLYHICYFQNIPICATIVFTESSCIPCSLHLPKLKKFL